MNNSVDAQLLGRCSCSLLGQVNLDKGGWGGGETNIV